MCSSCDEYAVEIAIHGPAQLRRIVEKLQAAVESGILIVDGNPLGKVNGDQPEFLALTLTGSSPDVLVYDFSCATCGLRFALECETYHGAGGHWGRV